MKLAIIIADHSDDSVLVPTTLASILRRSVVPPTIFIHTTASSNKDSLNLLMENWAEIAQKFPLLSKIEIFSEAKIYDSYDSVFILSSDTIYLGGTRSKRELEQFLPTCFAPVDWAEKEFSTVSDLPFQEKLPGLSGVYFLDLKALRKKSSAFSLYDLLSYRPQLALEGIEAHTYQLPVHTISIAGKKQRLRSGTKLVRWVGATTPWNMPDFAPAHPPSVDTWESERCSWAALSRGEWRKPVIWDVSPTLEDIAALYRRGWKLTVIGCDSDLAKIAIRSYCQDVSIFPATVSGKIVEALLKREREAPEVYRCHNSSQVALFIDRRLPKYIIVRNPECDTLKLLMQMGYRHFAYVAPDSSKIAQGVDYLTLNKIRNQPAENCQLHATLASNVIS